MKPSELALTSVAGAQPEACATEVSFDALFGHEVVPMVRLAISLVDSAERAEEIVQDAFVKTLLAWGDSSVPAHTSGRWWSTGVAVNFGVGGWCDVRPTHASTKARRRRPIPTCSTLWRG
jgi:predicted RNA polymerase sigma factor